MKKYNKKIVLDYINGNDIEAYDIDELEKDASFMMEVFKYSNDFKMYQFLDDSLKSNLMLMKSLILKFHENKEFVNKVLSDFFAASSTANNIFEMRILVNELFREQVKKNGSYSIGHDYDIITASAVQAELEYVNLRRDYIYATKMEQDDCNLQMGFYLFNDMFSGNQTIIDYIAKKMIHEIFYDSEYSLETLIHLKFKNKTDIKKVGINTFLLLYIERFDKNLADYVKTDIKLMEEVIIDANRIICEFDQYNANRNKELMEWIIDYIVDYSMSNSFFLPGQLIRFISKDLGINDPILKAYYSEEWVVVNEDKYSYDNVDEEEYMDNVTVIPPDDTSDDEENYQEAIKDIRYHELKRKIEKAIQKNEPLDDYVEEMINKQRAKVIKFPANRKPKN